MTPSFGAYLAGSLSLVAIVASLGFGAYWLRRWIVPEFSGALARLAEITLGVGLFVLVLYLLGSLSILREGWLISVAIALGLATGLVGRARAPRDVTPVEPPNVGMWPLLIAIAVASFTVAEWTFPSLLSLDRGMFGGDTTWYHMPFSARFAQDASTVALHFTDPMRLVVWFYPATSELINGAGIVVMRNDFLSPLLNMGLACGRTARRLVHRAPLRRRPGDPGRLGPGLRLRRNGRDPGRRGPQRHHGDLLPGRLRRLHRQRPPGAPWRIAGHRRRRRLRRPDRPRPADPGRARRRARDLGQADDARAGGGNRRRGDPLQRPRAAHPDQHDAGARRRAFGHRAATGSSATCCTRGNPTPQIGFGPLNLPVPDQLPLDPRPRFSVAHYLFEPSTYRNWFFPSSRTRSGRSSA